MQRFYIHHQPYNLCATHNHTHTPQAETNIVVLQTTNHIFNNSILNTLTPHSAVSWQRVRVANMLATNGSAWADLLARENSGTYNNQYMVVDLKRFVPHKVGGVVVWGDWCCCGGWWWCVWVFEV